MYDIMKGVVIYIYIYTEDYTFYLDWDSYCYAYTHINDDCYCLSTVVSKKNR